MPEPSDSEILAAYAKVPARPRTTPTDDEILAAYKSAPSLLPPQRDPNLSNPSLRGQAAALADLAGPRGLPEGPWEPGGTPPPADLSAGAVVSPIVGVATPAPDVSNMPSVRARAYARLRGAPPEQPPPSMAEIVSELPQHAIAAGVRAVTSGGEFVGKKIQEAAAPLTNALAAVSGSESTAKTSYPYMVGAALRAFQAGGEAAAEFVAPPAPGARGESGPAAALASLGESAGGLAGALASPEMRAVSGVAGGAAKAGAKALEMFPRSKAATLIGKALAPSTVIGATVSRAALAAGAFSALDVAKMMDEGHVDLSRLPGTVGTVLAFEMLAGLGHFKKVRKIALDPRAGVPSGEPLHPEEGAARRAAAVKALGKLASEPSTKAAFLDDLAHAGERERLDLLAAFERHLGNDHPYTKALRDSLTTIEQGSAPPPEGGPEPGPPPPPPEPPPSGQRPSTGPGPRRPPPPYTPPPEPAFDERRAAPRRSPLEDDVAANLDKRYTIIRQVFGENAAAYIKLRDAYERATDSPSKEAMGQRLTLMEASVPAEHRAAMQEIDHTYLSPDMRAAKEGRTPPSDAVPPTEAGRPQGNVPPTTPEGRPGAVTPPTAPPTPTTAATPRPASEPKPPPVTPPPREPIKPIAVGKEATVTAGPVKVKARYAIVDADHVLTSADEGYPEDWQPRDRGTLASDLQIEDIAKNPDFDRLRESPTPSPGAPVITKDGQAINNGRVLAVRKMYAEHPDRAEAMKADIIAHAKDLHLEVRPDQLRGKPFLARIADDFPDDGTRKEFIKWANKPEQSGMSAARQAKEDAGSLTPAMVSLLRPGEGADLSSGQMYPFLQAFQDQIVTTGERDDFMDAKGRLSADGMRRVRNAILAKAYGDSEVLRRATESTDDNVKSVTNALVNVAPKWIGIKAGIEEGSYHDLDISPEIGRAVEILSDLRANRKNVQDWIVQYETDKEGKPVRHDPIVEELVASFGLKKNGFMSTEKLTDLLDNYVKQVENGGGPEQGGFFDTLTKESALAAAIQVTRREHGTGSPLFEAEPGARGEAGKTPPTARGEGGEGKEGDRGSRSPTRGDYSDVARAVLAATPHGRVYDLSGAHMRDIRQSLMEMITGEKSSKAKSGVGALQGALLKFAGISKEGKAPVEYERELEAWLRDKSGPGPPPTDVRERVARYGPRETQIMDELEAIGPRGRYPTGKAKRVRYEELQTELRDLREKSQADTRAKLAAMTFPELNREYAAAVDATKEPTLEGLDALTRSRWIQAALEARERQTEPIAIWAAHQYAEEGIVPDQKMLLGKAKALGIELHPDDARDMWEGMQIEHAKLTGQPEPAFDEPAGPRGISKMRVEEGRAAAGITERFMGVMARNLYSGNIPELTVKELLQNSVDSLRGVREGSGGKISVDIDTAKREIVITDNGSGMSPDTTYNEFVDVGGTKKPEGASGGYGIAKAAILGNAQHVNVTTTWRDPENGKTLRTEVRGGEGDAPAYMEWVDQSRGLKITTTEMPDGTETGSTLRVAIRKPSAGEEHQLAMYGSGTRDLLDRFLGQHRLPYDFTFTQDGDPVAQQGSGRAADMTLIKTLTFPGGEADIYATAETHHYDRVYADILNNGLPQFASGFSLPKDATIPRRLSVNIRSKASPDEPNYPFSPSRESLRGDARTAVERYIDADLYLDSVKKERDLYIRTIKAAPIIEGAQQRIGQSLPRHAIVDTSGTLPPDLVEELRTRPYSLPLSRALGRVVDTLRVAAKSLKESYEEVAYIGLGTSSGYLGVNVDHEMVYGSKGPDLIMFNPWAIVRRVNRAIDYGTVDKADQVQEIANHLVATAVHEIAHQGVMGHSESFAGQHTDLNAHLMQRQGEAAKAIVKVLEGIGDDGLRQIADDGHRIKAIDNGINILGKVGSSHAAPKSGRSAQGDRAGDEEGGRGLEEGVSGSVAGKRPGVAEGAEPQGGVSRVADATPTKSPGQTRKIANLAALMHANVRRMAAAAEGGGAPSRSLYDIYLRDLQDAREKIVAMGGVPPDVDIPPPIPTKSPGSATDLHEELAKYSGDPKKRTDRDNLATRKAILGRLFGEKDAAKYDALAKRFRQLNKANDEGPEYYKVGSAMLEMEQGLADKIRKDVDIADFRRQSDALSDLLAILGQTYLPPKMRGGIRGRAPVLRGQTRSEPARIAPGPSLAHDGPTDKQLESIYDDVETRPGTTEADKAHGIAALRSLFKRDREAGGSILGSALAKDFQERKGTELVGQIAETPHELALLGQIFSDKRLETFRIFFRKGKEIVGHSGLRSNLPNIAHTMPFPRRLSAKLRDFQSLPPDEQRAVRAEIIAVRGREYARLKAMMTDLGADGYDLLHNHPSGAGFASDEDVDVTREFARHLPGLRSHVIINHKTYGLIDAAGNKSERPLGFTRPTAAPELPHDALGRVISGPSDLAVLGQMLQKRDGYTTLIAVGAQNHVMVIAEVPTHILTGPKSRALARLRKFALGASSLNVHAVGDHPGRLDRLIRAGGLYDAVSTDGSVSRRASGVPFGGSGERAMSMRRVSEPKSGSYGDKEKAPIWRDNILDSLKSWQPKGTVDQLQKHLAKTAGTKDEAAWIGLDDFLKDKPNVTRAEVEEFVSSGRQSAIRNFSDVTKPESVGELAKNVLGAEVATAMPLKAVDGGVLSALHHDEVQRAVVASLPVDVVDHLRAAKSTPDELLRNPDVVVARLPADHRGAVAHGLLHALRSVGAHLRAELLSGGATGGDIEILPALKASDLSAREVAGVLAPARLYEHGILGGAGDGEVALPGAVDTLGSRSPARGVGEGLPASSASHRERGEAAPPRAEPPIRSARPEAESTAASLAHLLNWHGGIIRDAGSVSQERYAPPLRESALSEGMAVFERRAQYGDGPPGDEGEPERDSFKVVTAKLPVPSRKDRLLAKWERLSANVDSQHNPLNEAQKEIRKYRGQLQNRDLPLSKQVELAAGAVDWGERRAREFRRAVIDPIAKMRRADGKKPNGYQQWRNTKLFEEYLFLNRTANRLVRNIKTGDWTLEKVRDNLDQLQSEIGSAGSAEFARVAREYQRIMGESLQRQAGGTLSQEQIDDIRAANDFYAPFRRLREVEEEDAASRGGTGKSVAGTSPLTGKLRGANEEDVAYPNILRDSAAQIVRSEILAAKNEKMRMIGKLAIEDTEGRFFRPLGTFKVEGEGPLRVEKPPDGFLAVTYLDNGKEVHVAVRAAQARAIRGLDAIQLGPVSRFLLRAQTPFYYGTIPIRAAYQVKNAIRDMMRLSFMSKYGLNTPNDLVTLPIEWADSFFASLIDNSDDFRKIAEKMTPAAAHGALIERSERMMSEASKAGVFAGTASRLMYDKFGSERELGLPRETKAGRTITGLLNRIDNIADFSKAVEEASKLTAFRRGMRIEGVRDLPPHEAATIILKMAVASEGRNYGGSPDFAVSGNIDSQMTPLFVFYKGKKNGALSDAKRLMGTRSGGGGKVAARTWARLAAFVGLPVLLLALRNRTTYKDSWTRTPEDEKKNYLHFFQPWTIQGSDGKPINDSFKMPIGDTVQMFANMTDAAVDFAFEQDPKAAKEFAINFLENMSPVNIQANKGEGLLSGQRVESALSSLTPPGKGAIEIGTGRDTFRHRNIEPDYVRGVPSKDVAPEKRFDPRTTPEFYVKIAEELAKYGWHFSPAVLHRVAEDTLGSGLSQFFPSKAASDRPGIQGVPIVGDVARLFRGSGRARDEALGAALKKVKGSTANTTFETNKKAQDLANRYESDKAGVTREIGLDGKLKAAVVRELKAKELGLTYDERQVETLSAADGTRARFIFDYIKNTPAEQRADLVASWKKKGIINENVGRQLDLLEKAAATH